MAITNGNCREPYKTDKGKGMQINWEQFILTLGSSSVVLIGIIKWVGALVGKKLVKVWETQKEEQIELLKDQLDKNRLVLHNSIQTIQNSQSSIIERRLEATTELWKSILKIRHFASSATLYYSTFSPEFFPSSYKSNDIAHILSEYTLESINAFSKEITTLELHRLFVGEKLWLSFTVYFVFLIRLTIEIEEGYSKKSIKDWTKESTIIAILARKFNKEEMTAIQNPSIIATPKVIAMLESKIIEEIHEITTGETATKETVQIAQRIIDNTIDNIKLQRLKI